MKTAARAILRLDHHRTTGYPKIVNEVSPGISVPLAIVNEVSPGITTSSHIESEISVGVQVTLPLINELSPGIRVQVVPALIATSLNQNKAVANNSLIAAVTLTAGFTQPAVNSGVSISVTSNTNITPGMQVIIGGAGFYTVFSKTGSTTIDIINTEDPLHVGFPYPGNATTGTPIQTGARVLGINPNAPWANANPVGYTPAWSATLTGPTGDTYAWTELAISFGVREGWTWSATLAPVVVDGVLTTIDTEDTSLFPFEGVWKIRILDGFGNELDSPPLMNNEPSLDDPSNADAIPFSRVGGVDLTTYRMSRAAEDFSPSFRFTSKAAIIGQLATRANVSIANAPTSPVLQEDLKQASLFDALNRCLDSEGWTWHVDSNGVLQCRPWENCNGPLQESAIWPKWWRKMSKTESKSARYTAINFGKRSPLASGGGTNPTTGGPELVPWQLPAVPVGAYQPNTVGQTFIYKLATPLADIYCYNTNNVGFVGDVAWYSGDPATTGKQVGFAFLVEPEGGAPPVNSVSNGSPPITHIVYTVYPPRALGGFVQTGIASKGDLAITGQPWVQRVNVMPQVDTSFLYPYSTSETPIRNAGNWIDIIHQSKAALMARAPIIMAQKRATVGYRRLTIESVMLVGFGLFETMTYTPPNSASTNNYRSQRVSHRLTSSGAPSTTIECVRYAV